MPAPTVVILAGGLGTRMKSVLPKVLHPVAGRPMVLWPVLAARAAGAGRVVVVGGPDRALAPVLPEGVELAVQAEPRGTGDAVAAARDALRPGEPVLILSGDVPLVTAEAITALVAAHAELGAAGTVVTMEPEDPAGYGRVVRDADGRVERIVETKNPENVDPAHLGIGEVNTGVYLFDGGALHDALDALEPDNDQGELFLPDVVPALRARGLAVAAHRTEDPALTLGVNDRADLAEVTRLARRRINRGHMRAGVTLVDPATAYIDAGVEIAADTEVGANVTLQGSTRIGAGCRVGPNVVAIDATLEDGAAVGPFAYLRPGTVLREGAKAGTFVEIKNSDVGAGTKVPHLSYVGDADIGPGSNLGAGTITANYDGFAKHRTTIGRDVRISVDTALVAPVSVGDGAYTGAGSVITDDVPAGALGVARERQRNVEGYAERAKSAKAKKPAGGGVDPGA